MDFSLNMVKIKKVPACFRLPASLTGQIAWKAFSADTVCRRIARDCGKLGLENNSELPKGLSECLRSGDPQIKALASEIADELGRRLALAFYSAKQLDEPDENRGREDFDKFQAGLRLCSSRL